MLLLPLMSPPTMAGAVMPLPGHDHDHDHKSCLVLPVLVLVDVPVTLLFPFPVSRQLQRMMDYGVLTAKGYSS